MEEHDQVPPARHREGTRQPDQARPPQCRPNAPCARLGILGGAAAPQLGSAGQRQQQSSHRQTDLGQHAQPHHGPENGGMTIAARPAARHTERKIEGGTAQQCR